MTRPIGAAARLACLLALVGWAVPSHAAPDQAPTGVQDETAPLQVPDVEVRDQDGRALRFHTDVVKGRVVAINFIFTSCGGICPALGAMFGKLQDELGAELGRDVHLVSVSIDPVTDTPERLKAWAGRFGARPGWTLVTGDKAELERLARALAGVGNGPKETHAAVVLLGNEARGRWQRAYGFTKPAELARLARDLARLPAPAAASGEAGSAAARWFTDTVLVDQDGRERRFYSDVLKGHVVVLSSFFTSCASVCPVIQGTLAKVQDALGERLGKDAFLVSISVDPENDTPERLRDFAKRMQARPGWIFLTGAREPLETVLYKLGYKAADRDAHSTLVLIGNEPRQYWKKAMGLADAKAIIPLVEEVLNDGAAAPPGQ
jgi:cytochrome oxidase Cu insertion factor (SCO1/SenC/PrrC family)